MSTEGVEFAHRRGQYLARVDGEDVRVRTRWSIYDISKPSDELLAAAREAIGPSPPLSPPPDLSLAVEMMRRPGACYAGVARELGIPVDEVRRAAKAAGIVRPRGVPKGFRRPIKIDDDVLRAMVAAGRSPKEMADRFACSKQAIWDARKRLGLLK